MHEYSSSRPLPASARARRATLFRPRALPLRAHAAAQTRIAPWCPTSRYFNTSCLPRYTIGFIGGETDADTRGCLETVVRVHGFGEFAETHAGGGTACARF